MGRTVEDTIRLLHTMSGYDPRAPLSARDSLPGYSQFHAAELSRVKIGWMADYEGYLPMEAGVLALCEDVLKLLAAHGADVDKCLPNYDMASLWEVWLTFRHWSMSSLKPFYDEPKLNQCLTLRRFGKLKGASICRRTDCLRLQKVGRLGMLRYSIYLSNLTFWHCPARRFFLF